MSNGKPVAISTDARDRLDEITDAVVKKVLAEAGNIALKRDPKDIKIISDDIINAWDKMKKSGLLAEIGS
jgi:hypothetical protein